MGGIGKTTLARAFYNMASSQFEGSSFLANVKDVSKERWEGLKSLQEQLLSETLMEEHTKIWDAYSGMNILKNRLCRKKVIVIIDDVDKLDQLKKLAGKFDWFGSGSRIIITTRDQSLLTAHGVKEIYNVELLNHGEALQLFTWNAFKNVYPPNGYAKLSEQVIEYANGLPLALEVLGSTLCGKSVNEWKSQLDRLKRYPKKEIIDVLQISFDELEEIDKNIFLDIACFFKGYDKDYVIRILDSCGYHPEIGVRNLIDKSLLSITYNNFWMHDLLQEMGWKIVREKSHNELGRQSRLWNDADLSYVLYNNKATEEIEAIVCYQFTSTSSTQETLLSSSEAFSKMKKLRLLKLYGSCILPSLESLSNELRFIEWNRCPLKCFPSSFQPTELVVLELQQSSIKQLWNLSTTPLRNLKIVNLSACKSLVKIFQDFTMVPNLEELILSYCTELLEIDPSINILGKLTLLDLSYCWSLDNLPIRKNGLKSLKVVKLYGCLKLRNLPEDIGHLKSLEELDVRSTSIRELPSSIVLLENLESLSCGIEGIRGTNQLHNMINTIVGKVLSTVGLHSLKKLVLNACNLGEGAIPKELGFLVSLEDLDLSNNHFVCLPASISRLSKLKSLCLKNCTSLRSLTELPSSLAKVVANNCTALDTFLDPSKQYNLQCSALCAGCFKLARRQGSNMTIFTSLTRYLQKVPNTSQRLDIVLPGREISKWFTNQNLGSSISINLSPNWCDNNWMGFAFCICFHCEFFLGFFCDVKINRQSWGLGKVDFPINDEKNVKPYHLWFAYLPRNTFFSSEWEKSFGQIEFSFETPFRTSLKVKMCGVRLVYQQDITEFDKKQKPNPF